ncbi:MAG: ABC transporter permease subunit [Haloarculaceae archaeon]
MAGETGTGGSRTTILERVRGAVPHPLSLASVLAVLAAWQLLSLAFPPYRFPGLVRLAGNVAAVLAGTGGFDPALHYGVTLGRVLVGFVLSFVLAAVWGFGMGLRPAAEDYLGAPLFTLLTVPSVVWAFLGVLWFGLTEHLVPVFVVVLVVFPYMAVNLWEGVEAVDGRLVEMARAFDASTVETWRHVYLPQLLPTLFATTRLGLAIAWKLSLIAEVFGAATGVGVVVKYHFENFDTGLVIAWAVPVMLLMFGVEWLLGRAERRASRWRPEAAVGQEVAPE